MEISSVKSELRKLDELGIEELSEFSEEVTNSPEIKAIYQNIKTFATYKYGKGVGGIYVEPGFLGLERYEDCWEAIFINEYEEEVWVDL